MGKTERKKKRVHTTHLLVLGDALEVLSDEDAFPSESVDLVVTSPPYGLGKDYGPSYYDKFNLSEWIKMMEDVGELCQRVLRPNGSFFLNVSPIPAGRTKEIIPLDTYGFLAFKKSGYHLRNEIIWHFNNMQNCTKRLSGRWEAILWFVKDIDDYVFNLDDVRIPYITKGDKRITGTGRNPTDVWFFDRINNMTKKKLGIDHPCVYPDKMIERIIKVSSNVGGVVLDPFVGSGTTMRVSKILDRNSIGIEINPDYEDQVRRRVEPHISTLYAKSKFQVKKYVGGKLVPR